ncbi:MAG: stage II sporulation protein P [Clostridia bacterium]|nr:stage II sporulation protein P [Clostridia bacterium]
MKRFLFIFLMGICFATFGAGLHQYSVLADVSNDTTIYVIYDEEGNYLFERYNVAIGDEYIDKNMNSYEVVFIDESTKTGTAKYVKTYKMPKLKEKKETSVSVANSNLVRGSIGLYMSHNDESYISGDGYDSVYGKGGIHDITKSLATCLQSKAINVVVDETLHLPHDTYAYSRSSSTAKRLLNNHNLDALFDVHRDGTSRGFYITNVNGEERCMVRMVIGKSNPNYDINKGFALYLMSISQIYCPWLFVDIYMGSGHYNQALKDNMVLFEMGSHLVEKDLVLKTVPELAEVVSVALFGEFEEVEESENNSASNNGEIDNGIGNNDATSSSGTDTNTGTDNNASSGNGNIQNNSGNSNNNINNENQNSTNNQINSSQTENSTGVQNNTQINKDDNESNSNNLNEKNQSNIISGEKSGVIVVIVIVLLVGFVFVVSYLRKKNKDN